MDEVELSKAWVKDELECFLVKRNPFKAPSRIEIDEREVRKLVRTLRKHKDRLDLGLELRDVQNAKNEAVYRIGKRRGVFNA